MNLQFGERYEKLGAEAQAFCAGSWPPRGSEAGLPERAQAIAWRRRAMAAGFLHRSVPPAYGGAGASYGGAGAGTRGSGRPTSSDGRGTVDGAFAELGLSRGATAAEIKQTWRKLSLENHPDRVAHLGEEFRKLAEERMRRINAAYDVLKQTGFAS